MFELIRQRLRSRTYQFGTALLILSTLQANLNLFELTPQELGIAGAVIGLAINLLREITKEPLNSK